MKRMSAVTILGIANTILLTYAAWYMYYNETCPSCQDDVIIPFNGSYIALIGAGVSGLIAIFSIIQGHNKGIKYILLAIATISAILSSYLQAAQFLRTDSFCFLCIMAAILFYSIFCILILSEAIRLLDEKTWD